MDRLICKKGLFYAYFLIEHKFWIFVRIASLRTTGETKGNENIKGNNSDMETFTPFSLGIL